MGTTVTTNLSLIKPDTDEKIKEDLPTFDGWATQNGVNCDKIDALFRSETLTWPATWTGSSNPVLGAGGVIEGKYIRWFPRMVIGFIRIYTGAAGFSAGTGGYSISAPAAIDPLIGAFANEVPVGKACFYDDSSAATSSAWTVMYSTSGNALFMRLPVGDLWSATTPVAPGQLDRISGYFMYPTQVA